MMGGPASGKTMVRGRDYAGLIVVDCDEIKAERQDFDPVNPGQHHEWSSQEATRRLYAALGAGLDVVFDGTGNTAEKYVAFIHAAQAAGYKTEVCYVATTLDAALARNRQRARTVDESIVRERHARVAVSFEIVSRYADRVRVVRN
jgi:predicted ABC-type ATPase